MGEPFNLGDGRRVAMLAQVIGQGQRLRDGDEPCQQPECVVGLGQAEVATPVTLPRSIRLDGGNNCTFQDGVTFYVGTSRANYLCEQRAFGVPPGAESWIIGGPITRVNGLSFVHVAGIFREGVVLDANRPGGATCRDPICVSGTISTTVDPRFPSSP
jgi:hypothetical protein